MANEISSLSTTDASNTARFPESQAPSTVNDGARALEGMLARGLKDTIDGALTTGGTSTAYTCTLNRSSVSAWYTGLSFRVKWNATCGATPTINPTGSAALGAKSLYWPNGTQVTSNQLVSGGVSDLYYDGTNVQVISYTSALPVPVAMGGTNSTTASAARTALGVAIGTDVQAYDVDTLKADTADVLTAGFAGTPYNAGTKSSGTFTPDEANGNLQYCVNGGAFTLAPPSNNTSLCIQITNNGSAGTITTSGFTQVTGDSFDTTDTNVFLAYIVKHQAVSHLNIVAMQ